MLEKVVVALTACTNLIQVCAIVLRYVPYKITGTNYKDPIITVSVSGVVYYIITWSSHDSVSNVVVGNVISDSAVSARYDSVITVVVGNVVINITVTTPKLYPIITVAKSNNPLDLAVIDVKTNPIGKAPDRPIADDNPVFCKPTLMIPVSVLLPVIVKPFRSIVTLSASTCKHPLAGVVPSWFRFWVSS